MKLGYSTYQWGGRQSRYQPTSRRNMTKTFDKAFSTTIRTTLYSGCKNCLWHHPVSPFLLSKLISHVGSRPVGHRTKKPLFPSPLLPEDEEAAAAAGLTRPLKRGQNAAARFASPVVRITPGWTDDGRTDGWLPVTERNSCSVHCRGCFAI